MTEAEKRYLEMMLQVDPAELSPTGAFTDDWINAAQAAWMDVLTERTDKEALSEFVEAYKISREHLKRVRLLKERLPEGVGWHYVKRLGLNDA